MNKKTTPFPDQIAIQSWLRPALTPIPANIDYDRFKNQLDAISQVLRTSGLEAQAIDLALEDFPRLNAANRARRAQFAVESLRVEVLRHLLNMPSLREVSTQICSSDLLSDFCGLRRLDGIRGASKSTLDRRSKLFGESPLRSLHQSLTEVCGNADLAELAGLNEPINMETCLVDSTCLEADIHFPVDWVLLKDVAQTLLKATALIRREGVRCRMPMEPEGFAREMNRLCIEMTHVRRKHEAKKKRKKVLRKMKKLLRTIGEHARGHEAKLRIHRGKTPWSLRQMEQICQRINEMLGKMNTVIKQAHERIIGGRKVNNEDKLLSVYHDNIQVVVRGKASKEVEFGNTLFLSENKDGYLTDWKLYREQAPDEPKQLRESLDRQSTFDLDDAINETCSDRGFASKSLSKQLQGEAIYDALCPKSLTGLKERMKEDRFRELQKRRASTEARIAIIKNGFLGKTLRVKGYRHRAQAVAWAVLAHNLWFIAKRQAQEKEGNGVANAA